MGRSLRIESNFSFLHMDIHGCLPRYSVGTCLDSMTSNGHDNEMVKSRKNRSGRSTTHCRRLAAAALELAAYRASGLGGLHTETRIRVQEQSHESLQ